MGCSSVDALYHVVGCTFSVLVDAPQISLLVALLRVFGVSVGFCCLKMHFSCPVDFDSWEQTKILVNMSGWFGWFRGWHENESGGFMFVVPSSLSPLADYCWDIPLTVTDINEAALAQL